MRAADVLAITAALGGGLPPFPHWKRRLAMVPNPQRQEAAVAKRARKAAKRASDAERTAEGRVSRFCDTSHMSERGARVWGQSLHIPRRVLLGQWDFRSLIAATNGGEVNADTNWRLRLNARRSLPMPVTWRTSRAQIARFLRSRRRGAVAFFNYSASVLYCSLPSTVSR